jgi:hypothetical protein
MKVNMPLNSFISCDAAPFFKLVTGLAFAVWGYFAPTFDIILALLVFFIADMIFGFLVARKFRGEKFKVKIVWENTIVRLLISVVTILLLFVWDSVFSQDFVSTYNIAGWFISGVVIFSILENMYKLTKWMLIPRLMDLINKKTGGEFKNDQSK